jgi:hypothetical protein
MQYLNPIFWLKVLGHSITWQIKKHPIYSAMSLVVSTLKSLCKFGVIKNDKVKIGVVVAYWALLIWWVCSGNMKAMYKYSWNKSKK